MKVLFLENHEVFAKAVVSQFLAKHDVRIVASLAEARDALDAETFEVALVDFDLDDGKGVELVRKVREIGMQMKIIAVSSHEYGNSALVEAGADAVCAKLDFDQIDDVIAKL